MVDQQKAFIVKIAQLVVSSKNFLLGKKVYQDCGLSKQEAQECSKFPNIKKKKGNVLCATLQTFMQPDGVAGVVSSVSGIKLSLAQKQSHLNL